MEQAKRLELIKSFCSRRLRAASFIKPAKADRQLIASALDTVNAALKETGKAALSMDNADAGIDGGFVLTANGYEKNCSLRGASKGRARAGGKRRCGDTVRLIPYPAEWWSSDYDYMEARYNICHRTARYTPFPAYARAKGRCLTGTQ